MATEPDPDATAAELALGLLDGADRAAALRRVLAEPAFAREVETWRAHFARLFGTWPEVAPPPGLFDRIEASIAPPPVKSWPWKAISGASSMVAAALLVALFVRPAGPPPIAPVPQAAPLVASLAATGKETAGPVAAVYDRASGQIRLASATLAPDGKTAELWAIPGDGVPRPIGLLIHGKPTNLALPVNLRGQMASGLTLAISIEPKGGSPTGLPTGPVVAVGTLIQA